MRRGIRRGDEGVRLWARQGSLAFGDEDGGVGVEGAAGEAMSEAVVVNEGSSLILESGLEL